MRVKLTNEQFKFLEHYLKSENPTLFAKFEENRNGKVFDVDEDVAIEIRDWAGEKLQTEGFDINYEANEIGVILEQLIDVFYC